MEYFCAGLWHCKILLYKTPLQDQSTNKRHNDNKYLVDNRYFKVLCQNDLCTLTKPKNEPLKNNKLV